MSIFSRLFGTETPSKPQPNIVFGRNLVNTKNEAQYDAWDTAVALFEQGKHMESYQKLLLYLKNDDGTNVKSSTDSSGLRFEILQGSKKITGFANDEKIKAMAKIARVQELQIGFLRRLTEGNYTLKYGRYCLDDDGDVAIVFDSMTLDASPYKLYYGLREIALAADKHDDLMVEEFDTLQPVNTGHIADIPEDQKQVKSNFIYKVIEEVIEEVNNGRVNPNQYPGGITYLLLDAVYKLDFLTKPEGHTMETLERMHRSYFEVNGLNNVQKNHALVKEFESLAKRPPEKIHTELYNITHTFSMISATNHAEFRSIVEGEIDNMDWYIEHRYHHVALAIPGYIVGHSLFSFSLPDPDRDLLLLYYQIIEHAYFQELGYDFPYRNSNGSVDLDAIQYRIAEIVNTHSGSYPFLTPNYKLLKDDHITLFAKSYLLMISDLNLSKST